ncbi:MAG TPA: helix-turn-helix transcriptional regulator [Firmicutes bacterium]|nr:helix-turn-helix transcriptional regulator [Bacillota bacterium]
MLIALGRRIRALRRLKRMTQQELATRLGFSATLLSYIERGLRKPTPQLLERIAEELNVAKEELFIMKESADVSRLSGRATGC